MKNGNKKIVFIILDVFMVTICFFFFIWLKPATRAVYLPKYAVPFLILLGIWIIISYMYGKYNFKKVTLPSVNKKIIISNILVIGLISILIFALQVFDLSRQIVFGTFFAATIMELFFGNLYSYIVSSQEAKLLEKEVMHLKFERPKDQLIAPPSIKLPEEYTVSSHIEEFIIDEMGQAEYLYMKQFINPENPHHLVISTTTKFNIDKQPDNFFEAIVNLQRINDIRFINKFFESINVKLPNNGLFIGCVETKNQRKERIFQKYPPVFNSIYYSFDFILKRIFPKFWLTKKLYFFLTRGQNRVITRAETLGRLYSCGFEVVDEHFFPGRFFFVCRKIKEPAYDMKPTYGPFIKLKRVGKNGKIIKVYKFRTMHPYAEYLQEYVYKKNALQEGGKFKDDFRVTTLGKFLRKFWLDELPMFINLFKGDLKIVGVRPISNHYFQLYPTELKEKRNKTKPGLVPPFYADMPKTFDEIVATELRYLNAHDRHPIITDLKYFFRASFNILFKKARSN